MITETVVFTMLAERNLGPRLFGVFPGGRLEEFIPGHPLTTVEMRSQEFSEQIARNVALVHSLEVPVSKEPTWLADTMRTYLHRLSICPERVPEEEREHAVALANWDVRQEVDWLLGFLKTVDSPVVFSHNDINTGNILVREDPSSWDPVVFIDYEFAAYNYRAFDIANHFNEWMYDYGRKVKKLLKVVNLCCPTIDNSHSFPSLFHLWFLGLPLLLPTHRPISKPKGARTLGEVRYVREGANIQHI